MCCVQLSAQVSKVHDCRQTRVLLKHGMSQLFRDAMAASQGQGSVGGLWCPAASTGLWLSGTSAHASAAPIKSTKASLSGLVMATLSFAASSAACPQAITSRLLSDMCSGCLLSRTAGLRRRRPVGPLESQIAVRPFLPLELVPADTMPFVAVGATRGEGAGQQHPTIYSAAQLCLSLNPSSVCVTHTASRVMAIR